MERLDRSLCRMAIVSALALAAAGAITACGGSGSSSGSSSGAGGVGVQVVKPGASQPTGGKPVTNVNWAVSGDPVKMDPAYAYDYVSTPIVSQMCEGLLKFDEATGQLLPNLAVSSREVNPTTYVYNLRSGVKFWDGSPLTPQDVQFSLARIGDPKVAAYASSYYAYVKSIVVTGPEQVTVHLKQPDAQWKYVPAMTSTGGIISKAYALKHAKDLGLPSAGIMCTGPFKFKSWTRNQQVVLVRNDNWWNQAHLPKVAQITFQVIPDETTLIAALNNGSVDGTLYQFDGREAKQLSGPLRLYDSPSSNYFSVYFNTQRKPWNDPRVRQAFAYALDYQGIISSVYNGYGQRLKSVAPPVLWTFSKPVFQQAYGALPVYSVNLSKARQLVNEAGAKGATGTLMVNGPTDQHVGLIVQQAGQQIGIKLSIQNVPFAKKTAIEYNAGPKSYDLDILAWLSDTPEPLGILQPEYNSANVSSNIAAYKNPQVDKYLNAAAAETDPNAEAQDIVKAQAIIMNDVPAVPYIASDSLVPLNNRLTGFTPSFFSYWNDWAADLSGT